MINEKKLIFAKYLNRYFRKETGRWDLGEINVKRIVGFYNLFIPLKKKILLYY
jgi:hypothetical protein